MFSRDLEKIFVFFFGFFLTQEISFCYVLGLLLQLVLRHTLTFFFYFWTKTKIFLFFFFSQEISKKKKHNKRFFLLFLLLLTNLPKKERVREAIPLNNVVVVRLKRGSLTNVLRQIKINGNGNVKR